MGRVALLVCGRLLVSGVEFSGRGSWEKNMVGESTEMGAIVN